ncbi:MAG: regulatory protein RecX [Armatimonadetes bacterium]|nr:regulatory protein RecX [Armatimonadota bacterium]
MSKWKRSADIRETALRLLDLRAHSTLELSQKLQNRGFPGEEISELLTSLAEQGLLDDEKYGIERLRTLRSRKKGRRKVEYDLISRGLKRDLVERILARFSLDDEEETARRLLQEKGFLHDDSKGRRFLELRGFSYDAIGRVVRDQSIDMGP